MALIMTKPQVNVTTPGGKLRHSPQVTHKVTIEKYTEIKLLNKRGGSHERKKKCYKQLNSIKLVLKHQNSLGKHPTPSKRLCRAQH